MLQTKTPFKKGYKFRVYPNASQIELFEKTFGCCRYVWNKTLAETKEQYQTYLLLKDLNPNLLIEKPNVSGYSFVKNLLKFKYDENSLWLNEVSACALQQTMLCLGTAFTTFFRNKKGYPNFKSKHGKQSFSLMKHFFSYKNDILIIAKSKDPLIFDNHRKLPSEPTSVAVSKSSSGKYYISFICEYNPVKTTGTGHIGIDLGIKDFLVTSDGIKVSNPKYYSKYQKKLKRIQQSLSRKKKGSKNRNKARVRVALHHEKIVNCRTDFLHKLSRKLVNENQVIGLETLKVRNLMKNHKLAKSIADVSWRKFTSMLNYKSRESQNCSLVYMDTYFPSSHICNVDQTKLNRKLLLSEREWTCPECGTIHDRDINAALNIKNEAICTMVLHKVPFDSGSILISNTRY